jgi:hypothetical protein
MAHREIVKGGKHLVVLPSGKGERPFTMAKNLYYKEDSL